MLSLGVIVSGGGTNLQAIFDAIDAGTLVNVRVSAVCSTSKDAYALARAQEYGADCRYIPKESFEDDCAAYFKSKGVGVVVLAGCLRILSSEFIAAFDGKIINVHPSLIPSFCGDGYYGLKVHEAALERGVKVTGATVHMVTSGTDEGPILLQKAVEVRPGDTPEILQRRVMGQAEWVILPEAIQMLERGGW